MSILFLLRNCGKYNYWPFINLLDLLEPVIFKQFVPKFFTLT